MVVPRTIALFVLNARYIFYHVQKLIELDLVGNVFLNCCEFDNNPVWLPSD